MGLQLEGIACFGIPPLSRCLPYAFLLQYAAERDSSGLRLPDRNQVTCQPVFRLKKE